MIDAHVHFWNPADLGYFWLEPDSRLYRAYLPEDLDAERLAMGVDGAVFVQASHDPRENAWALALTEDCPWLLGVIGWVDLERPDLTERLKPLARHPRFCGLRHLVHAEPDERWLLRPSVGAGLEVLAEHGLIFDLVVRPEQFRHLPSVGRAHPQLSFVLNHLGQPTPEHLSQWARNLERLAQSPNVTAKISGLPEAVADRAVRIALETFGADRLMLGGDYPVCTLSAPYSATLRTLLETLGRLESGSIESGSIQSICSTNAQRIYGLEPPSQGVNA